MKRNTRKQKTPKGKLNSDKIIKEQEPWLKKILKKISSAQILAIVIPSILTIAAVIVSIYLNNSNNKLEEKLRVEQANSEENLRLANDREQQHEDLVLNLDCFTLNEKQEYDVDIIVPTDENYLTFLLDIHNRGKLSAKDISLRFGSNNLDIFAIYPSPMTVNDSIYPGKKYGIIKFETFHPLQLLGVGIIFDIRKQNTEDKFVCNFTCQAENKANPVNINFNATLFRFSTEDEYKYFVRSKYGNLDNYLKEKDFIILNWREFDNNSLKGKHKVYGIGVNNDKVIVSECGSNK